MFFVANKLNSKMQAIFFLAEFFQVYIVSLVVTIFAKTNCYWPSNLLVRSVTYQLSISHKMMLGVIPSISSSF